MLFIACGLMGGSVVADPCDDYARAVDKYIEAIRQASQKLDQAADAHQFADAVTVFTSATEELTATLRDLGPQVTTFYQSHGTASLPTCDRAQEKLVAFAPELNAIGTKFASKQRNTFRIRRYNKLSIVYESCDSMGRTSVSAKIATLHGVLGRSSPRMG